LLKVNTNKNNLKVYLNNLAFNNFKKCETNNLQPEFKNKTRMIYSTIIEIIKAESLLEVRNESNQTHHLTNVKLSTEIKLFKSNTSLRMPKPSTIYDIFNLSNVNSDESLLIDYNRNELYKAFKLFKLTTSKKNETNNSDKNNNNIETLNL